MVSQYGKSQRLQQQQLSQDDNIKYKFKSDQFVSQNDEVLAQLLAIPEIEQMLTTQ